MKDFTYTYNFAQAEEMQLSRRQRRYIDLNTDACYAIHLRMRPWLEDRLADTPKCLTGIFWSLKKETECMTLREVKKSLFSKKIEDIAITNAEQLKQEIIKRGGTDFALIYELEGKPSKFVDFADDHLVECYFHRSFSNEVETVFQHFAEKVGGSNTEEAEQMRQFMQERVKDGMKLPELVDIFEDMAKIPLHCTFEILRVEAGLLEFHGQDCYQFDLIRQIPTGHDDEFFMIQMSVRFPDPKIFDDLDDDLDSDCREPMEDFFAEVRASNVYQQLYKKDLEILDIEITADET